MTALCGGGASGPKPGVADTIIFTAGALSSLLNNKGGYWATLAAPLLGVLAYDATSLCNTDPPAAPTISAAEYEALLQLGPWDELTAALGKLRDIATRLIWFDMCQCTSVATPALPTSELDPPANVTMPNYGGSGMCPQPRARINIPLTSGSPPSEFVNITRLLFPGFPIYRSVANANASEQDLIQIPNNWVSLFECADVVSQGTCSVGQGYVIQVLLFGATKLLITGAPNIVVFPGREHSCSGSTAPGVESSPYVIDHSTAKYLAVQAQHTSTCTGDAIVDYSLKINCTGTSTTGQDCCSDPTVLALLSQLMSQVNLIQRQQVPFGFVTGAVHSAISGSGFLDVQGLLGVLVSVDTLSSLVAQEAGSPTQASDLGWIAWGNTAGFTRREFLTNDAFVSFPPAAGQFVQLGYNLPPGVLVTITELVREP
jgi:hypothetical protein